MYTHIYTHVCYYAKFMCSLLLSLLISLDHACLYCPRHHEGRRQRPPRPRPSMQTRMKKTARSTSTSMLQLVSACPVGTAVGYTGCLLVISIMHTFCLFSQNRQCCKSCVSQLHSQTSHSVFGYTCIVTILVWDALLANKASV